MTSRGVRALLGSTVLLFGAGCADDSAVTPTAVTAQLSSADARNERTLAIELTTPSAADGGAIFSIEGPNIIAVAPAPGVDLVTDRAEAHGRTTINVLAVGPLRSGIIAWLTVQGVNSGNPFTARLTQVAAGAAEGYVQRSDLSGYRLTVRR